MSIAQLGTGQRGETSLRRSRLTLDSPYGKTRLPPTQSAMPVPTPKEGPMKVQELIRELQKFPPGTDVEIYAGKCCEVQPIHQVYFHPGRSSRASSWWMKPSNPASQDDATAPSAPLVEFAWTEGSW